MSETHTTIRTCDACTKVIPKGDSYVGLDFNGKRNEWGSRTQQRRDLCSPCATGFGLDVLCNKEDTKS